MRYKISDSTKIWTRLDTRLHLIFIYMVTMCTCRPSLMATIFPLYSSMSLSTVPLVPHELLVTFSALSVWKTLNGE